MSDPPSLRDLERAICCEGEPCIRGEACDAGKPWRVTVNPHKAALAVARLYCETWKAWKDRG